jgi:hypothetical protein
VPPQPSSPQLLPSHDGVQLVAQTPEAQTRAPVHEPQDPPQPSSPQALPTQLGVHAGGPHVPTAVQRSGEGQVPQVPPQPSSPQALPLQDGTHAPGGMH